MIEWIKQVALARQQTHHQALFKKLKSHGITGGTIGQYLKTRLRKGRDRIPRGGQLAVVQIKKPLQQNRKGF